MQKKKQLLSTLVNKKKKKRGLKANVQENAKIKGEEWRANENQATKFHRTKEINYNQIQTPNSRTTKSLQPT